MNPEIVAAGLTHSLLITPEGDVYQFGELTSECFTVPRIIDGLPPIVSVAAGSHFSLFVDHEGNAWGMGNSLHGQLGVVESCIETLQIKFEGDLKIKMAAASSNNFAVFLGEDGSVWTSGHNAQGQLGLGHFVNVKPTKIQNIPKICSVSAGYYHTLLLDENGEVWSCGYNVYGQLGRPTERYKTAEFAKMESPVRFKAASAGHFHSMFLDVEGKVWGCGNNENAPLALFHTKSVKSVEAWQENAKIVHISAGRARSLLIDDEGGVWYAGKKVEQESKNYFNANMVSKVPEISGCAFVASCGSHQLVADTGGNLWVWGNNKKGQLGLGHNCFECEPVLNELLPSIKTFYRTKSAKNAFNI